MATKTAYTAEETTALVEAYTAAETADDRAKVVEEMAVELKKSAKSVIAKLVREGVYVKKVATKKRATGVKKAELVDKLAELINHEDDEKVMNQLEKLTNDTLLTIIAKIEYNS